MSSGSRPLRIALLWSQFAAYHIDRCAAVARRLEGRAEVLAVEVASASATYAWETSGEVPGARKVTLFPGRSYESIPPIGRLRAQFRALRRCDMVFVGIGYNERDIVLLSWLLWLCRVEVVLMSESKFDDFPRRLGFELFKSWLLTPYRAAIVGGARHMDYMRLLGFRRRRVLPGYDGVGIGRIGAESGSAPAPGGIGFAERHFVYVGRFVEKKNLPELVEAYAAYAAAAGPGARRLVLAGSGPAEPQLRLQVAGLGIAGLVDFPGFLPAHEVSRLLARALALVLVSTVEQWGLVVNEALAAGLPAIVSGEVGARDALVRNLVNGYVVERGSVAGLAKAMAALAGDEAHWREMAAASHRRAWLGDTERFADAAELLIDPGAEPAASRLQQFLAELGSAKSGYSNDR